MDTQQKAALVIGLTLLVVILFNIAIYFASKRRGENSINQFKMFSRAFHRARNPWEEDQAKLDELSRKVEALGHKPDKINEGQE
jgi:hypothetical protein